MDVEKAPSNSKGHGFFNLFDWGKNKKCKKRLFNGSGSDSTNPRNTGDEKKIDGCAPSTRSNSILEDSSSLKESCEHSCSSSVVDEETQAMRCPTVVARLMGLDSMPVASLSESNRLPFAVQPPFLTNNHDNLVGRSYVDSPLKMPSSPIDRFKMEALPSRYAKRTSSVAQYKLLSPMKNSNFISSRNAADIMEAASRIIGPGVENTIPYRVHDVGHTNAVRSYNTREIIGLGVQQRSFKLNEELRKCGGSASSRPPSGKTSDGVSKSSDSTSFSRISLSNGCVPVGPKVKASSRSSNINGDMQAQGKEGIIKSSKKLETRSRNPENGMTLRNGWNQHNDINQAGTSSSSNVLVPNNRKQNAMVAKQKVNSNPAAPSRQRNSTCQINAPPRKVGATNTLSGNKTQGNTKVDLQQTSHSNMRTPVAKGIPKARRLQEKRIYSDKRQPSDNLTCDRSQKRIQHNIVIDEQSSFSKNKKKVSTEIVSFTFTSPVDKSLQGSHLPNDSAEEHFIENLNAMSTSNDTSDAKMDVIDGDYLRLLLDQKLRELTSGVKSPYSKPGKGVRIYAPSPIVEDTASSCETSSITSTDCDRELARSFKDGKSTLTRPNCITTSGQSSESAKYNNDVVDQAELEQFHLSPLSTWEASLSTETCSSSESCRSVNGTRLFGSADGATTSESTHFNKCLEVDASSDYSDTTSSITVATAEIPRSESSSSCHMDYRQEVEFIRELLSATSTSHIFSCLERFGNSDILDPHLLEELDSNISLVAGEEDKAYRLRRGLLFDCVNELLSLKCEYYFNAGYSSWYMGVAVLQNLSADDLYREMTSIKISEESMVDELVYRDMSSPLGSWVDFKMDSYQVAGDITMEILGSLVDEVVADNVFKSSDTDTWSGHATRFGRLEI